MTSANLDPQTVDRLAHLRHSSGKYRVQPLLAGALQPMPDLEGQDFEDFVSAFDISKMDPVRVTNYGRLYDGNQRCRALLAKGIKTIPANLVMIAGDEVTEANVMDEAVRINTSRRHLTSDQRRALIVRLATDGWTHKRIAAAVGVTRGRVSQIIGEAERGLQPAPVGRPPAAPVEVTGKPAAPKLDRPAVMRRQWVGPTAVIPKALAVLQNALVNYPPGEAAVMLTPEDRRAYRARMDQLVELLTEGAADLSPAPVVD